MLMATSTKDHGLTTRLTDMEHISMLTEQLMLANGSKTNSTGRVRRLGQMVPDTTACIKTARRMAKERLPLQMAASTQVNSL